MRIALGFLLALLVTSFSCATPDDGAPRYANATMGIASNFSEQWAVYTDHASAPELVKPQFPPDKGPDESPLLLAMRSTGDAFARVLVDPVPHSWDARQYFDRLFFAFGRHAEIFEVSQSIEHDAVRWVYRDRSMENELVFIETVTVRAGYGIRISYWTPSSVLPLYRSEFQALTEHWRFRDEEGEWQTRWVGLEDALSREGFEHIALVEPGRTVEGCALGEHPLLFEVPGEQGTLHLFGSVHLGEPSLYPLPDVIEAAFKDSDSLVVELDITAIPVQREVAALMETLGSLPVGEHVRDHLEAGTYRKLEEAFSELGIPMRSFTNLKPWAIATVLTAIKLQSLGYMPRYGVDRYFLDRAGTREIVSLETPREQLAMLDGIDGELYLAFSMLGFETFDQDAKDIMRAWRCGDADAIESLFVATPANRLPGSDDVLDAIFYERNERMADAAAKRLEVPGEHFMVVGAGHLVGERGIPALLRERGYEVISH